MTNPLVDQPDGRQEVVLLKDVLRPVTTYWRAIVLGSVVAGVAGVLLGGLYYALDPSRLIVELAFRPALDGAVTQKLAGFNFDLGDVTAQAVFDAASNGLVAPAPCSVDRREQLSIRSVSAELDALQADYDARLRTPGLALSDRTRFEAELETKRSRIIPTLVLRLELPAECAATDPVTKQLLARTVEQWSRITVLQVLKLPDGLSPTASNTNEPLIVRAVALSEALETLSRTVRAWSGLPGAASVKAGSNQTAVHLFTEAEKLKERISGVMETSGPGLGADSIRWLRHREALAAEALFAAEARRNAVRLTLAEYVDAEAEAFTKEDSAVPTGARQPAEPAVRELHRRDLAERLLEASNEVAEHEIAIHRLRRRQAGTERPDRQPAPALVEREFAEIEKGHQEVLANALALRDTLAAMGQAGSLKLYAMTMGPSVHFTKAFPGRSLALTAAGAAMLGLFVMTLCAIAWPGLFARRRAGA